MQLKKELGRNIQKFRKLNNITQEKLAEMVNIEINSISSIERGKYFPSPDNLLKIADALNVSLSTLFYLKNEISAEDYIKEINKNLNLIKTDKTKLSIINTFILNVM